MTTRNLKSMFQPGSVALIGGFAEPGSAGALAMRNLLGCGFAGEVMFVNSEIRAPAGYPAYAAIGDLPQPPDLAVVTAPPERLVEVITELAAAGARTAAIVTPGFRARAGNHFDDQVGRMLAAAGPRMLRILGPDTLGLMVPRLNLNAGCSHLSPLPGRLAFVTDSNAVLSATIDWATQRRIGFSVCVCLGSRIDIDLGDMIDYLAEDYATRAILLYIDHVSAARKFMSAARAAARMKPVVVVKADRHRPGKHHPGLSARTVDAVYDAAFLRAGLLRVADLKALFDSVTTLSMLQPVENNRLAILTNGRGIGNLALDALYDKGGRPAVLAPETTQRLEDVLPGDWSRTNPVDIRPDAGGPCYGAALSALSEDRGIDAILVLHAPSAGVSGIDVAAAVCGFADQQARKPWHCGLLTSWLGGESASAARRLLAEKKIPDYDTPSEAVRAFMQMVRYRISQEILMETPPNVPEDFHPEPDEARRWLASSGTDASTLTGPPAFGVLRAYGIACRSEAPAVESWAQIAPGDALGGPATGMFQDPVFGPVLFWGAASPDSDDRAVALPPLNMKLGQDFLGRSREFGRLANPTEAVFTVVKLSQLVCDFREITGIEIQLAADGVTAIRVRIDRAVSDCDGLPLAVCPYPKELESTISLTDGRTMLLRPVLPEDEPAFLDFFARLSAEAVRFRFLHPIKHLPHRDAARLTQIDYDREMILVLEQRDSDTGAILYGAVQVAADPNHESAEFAIVLRDDLTGLGLGPLMMRRMIEYARSRGIAQLHGDVLDDNRSMLRLCEVLGFKRRRDPDDPGIVKVGLILEPATAPPGSTDL